MVNLILLLLVAGGFVIFAIQNLSPVALVVLGVKMQALPLSVLMLSFLAAGALTTLLLSGFFSLSKNAAVRKSAQREAKRSPWTGANESKSPKNAAGFTAGGAAGGAAGVDGWERSKDWNDWAEPAGNPPGGNRDRQSRVRDDIRDRKPDPNPAVRQTPLEQTGFSRRDPEPRQPKEVYDAEYRVLIPPYGTPPPAPEPKDAVKPPDAPKPPANSDDEDWL